MYVGSLESLGVSVLERRIKKFFFFFLKKKKKKKKRKEKGKERRAMEFTRICAFRVVMYRIAVFSTIINKSNLKIKQTS